VRGVADDRSQMSFRLSPSQMRELENVASTFGKTKQRYLLDLVIFEIAEHKKREVLKFQPSAPASPSEKIDTNGLGISTSLKQKQLVDEVVAPAPTAPVIVQVGNTATPTANGSAPLGELDRLVLYVVKGDEFMRDTRKRTAIDMLTASATTEEELKVLVARLEEQIAIKTKTQAEQTPVGKIARMAYDKLMSLVPDALRGE
jgi:hypothetical protein